MTYLEALEIKIDFITGMKFADYTGKSQIEAFAERAKKYSKETLAEAHARLQQELDKEKKTLKDLFVLALKSKVDTEQD